MGVAPVEGDVNNPVSRHRYLYGNANPVSYADPSGKFPTLGELIESLNLQTLLLTYASLQLNTFQFLAGRAVTTQGSIEWTGNYYSGGVVPPGSTGWFGLGLGGGLMVLETNNGAGATTSYTGGGWLILGGLITWGPLPLSATGSSTTILSPAQWGTDIKNLSGGFMSFGGAIGGGWFSAGYSLTMMGFGVGKISDTVLSPFQYGFDASITGFTGISIPLWQINN